MTTGVFLLGRQVLQLLSIYRSKHRGSESIWRVAGNDRVEQLTVRITIIKLNHLRRRLFTVMQNSSNKLLGLSNVQNTQISTLTGHDKRTVVI